jgi:hypothetical protein
VIVTLQKGAALKQGKFPSWIYCGSLGEKLVLDKYPMIQPISVV